MADNELTTAILVIGAEVEGLSLVLLAGAISLGGIRVSMSRDKKDPNKIYMVGEAEHVFRAMDFFWSRKYQDVINKFTTGR